MDVQITNLLYNVLLTIISTGLPIVIGYIVMFIKSHYTSKQIESAKEIAKISVSYVEQIAEANGINGIDKFNKALASVKNLGNEKGLNFSDSQWKTLIESALKETVNGWNELSKVSLPIDNSDSTHVNFVEPSSVSETVTTKETLLIPDTTMKNTYDQIKEKATKDAELAVQSVLNSVQKTLQ
jgi:hypothetical protein